jgi:hypothetical protein
MVSIMKNYRQVFFAKCDTDDDEDPTYEEAGAFTQDPNWRRAFEQAEKDSRS